MSGAHAAWQSAATEGETEFFRRSAPAGASCSILADGASPPAVRREYVDDDGRCPAHYAALSPKGAELLRALLAAGGGRGAAAVLSVRDEAGWTPLHCAASAGRAENVSVILAVLVSGGAGGCGDGDAGALLLAATENGCTPVHYAASKGREEAMRALLSVGGDMALRQLAAKDKRCARGAAAAATALSRGRGLTAGTVRPARAAPMARAAGATRRSTAPRPPGAWRA